VLATGASFVLQEANAPKLAACQIGADSNLAASQFESGVVHGRRQDEQAKGPAPRVGLMRRRKAAMKSRSFVLVVAILVASVSAYAKLIPLRPFFFEQGITLNGVEIPHGMYSLSLDTQGSSVVVTLLKEGKFVATAHGTWVKHGVKYTENAVLLRVNPDGTRSLVELRLSGLAKTIMLDDVTQVLHVAPRQDQAHEIGTNQIRIGN
jgi:hypothetical protein